MRLILLLFPCFLLAQTSTLSTMVSASPNSVLVAYSSTGQLSYRIGCGTNNIAFAIVTPWVSISNVGTVTDSVSVAQLQPKTRYYCRLEGATLAAGGGVVTNSTSLNAITANAITSYGLQVTTQGAINSYNITQFPLNGRYNNGDTWYWTQLANNTIIVSANDGRGPQGLLFSGGSYSLGRNTWVHTMDSGFTNMQILNPLGTGDGSNGVGGQDVENIPSCYGDTNTSKSVSPYAVGNTLYLVQYRQLHVAPYTPVQSWINRSDDGGATWYNPSHTSGQASANGDFACPGAGVMWPGASNFGQPRFINTGKGGVVTNSVDGLDAYYYLEAADSATQGYTYLGRVFKKLNLQDINAYEYYIGAIGGDPNLPSNWTTNFSSLSTSNSITSDNIGNWEIRYMPDFGRFVMTQTVRPNVGDTRLQLSDSARITGPYVIKYICPTRTPQNGFSEYLQEDWLTFFMPSYTLTTSNPPSATVNMLLGGDVAGNHPTDPVNSWYSPIMFNLTITGQAAATRMLISQ